MIGQKSALLPLKLENLRLACQGGGLERRMRSSRQPITLQQIVAKVALLGIKLTIILCTC